MKTLVKMNLRSFKVNRAFGPAQYVKMQATFPEVEFLTILKRGSRIRRRMSPKFHVKVVQWMSKRCTKKRDARVELLF